MIRIAILAAAAALATLPAQAQSLDGGIFSGLSSGLGGGFSGGISSGLHSGLGARDSGRRAQVEDFTLGSGGGGFRAGLLRGQPSNFGPSVRAMSPHSSTLTYENGPQTTLDTGVGLGPAGPLD